MQRSGRKTHTQKQEHAYRLKYTLFFFGICLALILSAVFLTRCVVKRAVSDAIPVSCFGPGLEIPAFVNEEFLIVCQEGRYTLWYDTLYRQAAWAAYVLTYADVVQSNAERKDRFKICQVVRQKGWPYARERDYTGTGYDRGHLVPSADRVGSQDENDATFRMSNIAPQTPRLNRVLWNNLEQEIRRMTQRFDTLWIVTGGELKPGLPRIGAPGIGVPEYFFKALLAKSGNHYQAIAFAFPNAEEIEGTFWDYAVSVDEAEKLSGNDFFPNLPDALENHIEAECLPEYWQQQVRR